MGKCQRSNCTRFERWVLGAKGRSGETFLCAFLDLYWAVPGLREVEKCFCCRSNYSSWVLPVSRQDGAERVTKRMKRFRFLACFGGEEIAVYLPPGFESVPDGLGTQSPVWPLASHASRSFSVHTYVNVESFASLLFTVRPDIHT